MQKQKTAKGSKIPKDMAELFRPSLPRPLVQYGRTLTYKQAVGPIVTIDLVSVPTNISSASWSAGVLANSTDIVNLTTMIATWSARWGACFREYRVIGCRISARATFIGAAGQGELWFWLDEKSSATPTSADAQGARRAVLPLGQLPNGTAASEVQLSWMPHDLVDLDFTQTNAAASDIYLKAYAAPGVTNTGSTTAVGIIITASFRVQFRQPI